MRSLLLLGSTGSIGTQTLEIVREARDRFRIAALSAFDSWGKLLEQAREFRPAVVALADPDAAHRIRPHLPEGTALLEGPEASQQIAAEAEYDLAVHGIVGSAGVLPSKAVLERKRPLALANKESLVVAGGPLMELSRRNRAPILPVDSEHSAIFQCIQGASVERVRSIWLTASGGAFRDLSLERLRGVTPEMALEHPNWDMGPRITVGSATLMNKAFEVIEAHHLFGLAPERIGVLIHRQSIVHSMVEFVDGSVLAQLGPPDMRLPIHYALHWPERAPSSLRGFDLALFRELSFDAVDPERYPALELGYRCVREAGDAGAFLNAADEVAVRAFLERRIGFEEIVPIDRRVLDLRTGPDGSVEALLASDQRARSLAEDEIAARERPLAPR